MNYPLPDDTYRSRAAAWADYHMLCHPQDYARAVATWRKWQSNPVHLEAVRHDGYWWVRANGERSPAEPQPQARRSNGSNGHSEATE